MLHLIKIHRYTRRRILIMNTLMLVLVGIALYGVAYWSLFWQPVIWLTAALFIAGLLNYGAHIWRIYGQPGDFICSLYSDRIICSDPVPVYGSNFNLKLDDIAEIEEQEGPIFYLKPREGQKILPTSSFGNPSREFVEELKRLCPKAKVAKTEP